jgi:hypothetical protein
MRLFALLSNSHSREAPAAEEGAQQMKLRTWFYSTNNYVQWRIGDIHCIERPLWVAALQWFVQSVLGRGCSLLHWVKYPRWKITVDGEQTTVRDYYGDLGSSYHVHIYVPIFQWAWRVAERNQLEWVVKLGYEKLLEIFGEYDKQLEPIWGPVESAMTRLAGEGRRAAQQKAPGEG